MSEATIRTDIYDAINWIIDIGNVHDYDRFTADWTAFVERYSITIDGVKLMRGWDISYESMGPSTPMEFKIPNRYMRTHVFVIRGYLGMSDSDESEKTASVLAEAVCNAIDDDADLSNKNRYYQSPDRLARIRSFVSLVFGDVLCHYVEIETRVTEFIT